MALLSYQRLLRRLTPVLLGREATAGRAGSCRDASRKPSKQFSSGGEIQSKAVHSHRSARNPSRPCTKTGAEHAAKVHVGDELELRQCARQCRLQASRVWAEGPAQMYPHLPPKRWTYPGHDIARLFKCRRSHWHGCEELPNVEPRMGSR